jgi:TPR repeat protein
MIWFGSMILDPENPRRDLFPVARDLYAKIANLEDVAGNVRASAEGKFAEMCAQGKGGAQDKTKAYEYAYRAVQRREANDNAKLLFARLCVENDDPAITVDKALARRLLQPLIDNGNAEARELRTRLGWD